MYKFLLMTVPAYGISSLIFYFLYKKLGVEKFINHKKSRIVISGLVTFILYVVGLSITDSFNTTKEYHYLFVGLFLGPMIGLISFIMPANNRETKA